MIDALELHELVDWQEGLINPRIFIDEEIYQLELERLFGRAWLFLAHDSLIPNPGDFFSTYMGGDPVIVSRQKDGGVRAFLNVCRHRGMKVCRAEEGNTNAFMCTYHGWTYDGSGALVSVPNFEDAYYGELDMSRWGLVQIRVESYKGFHFGNFDADAPELVEFLGDMTWYMDSILDHAGGGIELVPGTIKWTIHGNWKVAAEQFAGDGYHTQVTHQSSPLAAINQGRQRDGRQFASRLGHGICFRVPSEQETQTLRFGMDVLKQYREDQLLEANGRLGVEKAAARGNFTVFPNLSGSGNSHTLRIWQPKGPNRFEIWAWTMVDRDAPEEVKRAQQLGSGRMEGAAGMVEVDDGENWDLMGQLLEHGSQLRKYAWNYQMGLGHESSNDPIYPGRLGLRRYGETPQRGFYRRWLEFLTSAEWPHVPADERMYPLAEQLASDGRTP